MYKEDVLVAIEVMNAMLDVHAKELYLLDEAKSRDWKLQYKHQLKIDTYNEVLNDLREFGNLK